MRLRSALQLSRNLLLAALLPSLSLLAQRPLALPSRSPNGNFTNQLRAAIVVTAGHIHNDERFEQSGVVSLETVDENSGSVTLGPR